MSDLYLSVGDSGVGFTITTERGPTVVVTTSAWGNLNHELKFFTTNEGLRKIGELFIEASQCKYTNEYCYPAKPIDTQRGEEPVGNDCSKGSESPVPQGYLLKEEQGSAPGLSDEEVMNVIREANDICRSAMSIAERQGDETNWDAFSARLSKVLDKQHKIIYPVEHYEK
jgi:hypothetical protein